MDFSSMQGWWELIQILSHWKEMQKKPSGDSAFVFSIISEEQVSPVAFLSPK